MVTWAVEETLTSELSDSCLKMISKSALWSRTYLGGATHNGHTLTKMKGLLFSVESQSSPLQTVECGPSLRVPTTQSAL